MMFLETVLFKAYCLCMYDIALWSNFNVGSLLKLQSCYNKCIKLFFGFRRRDSLTAVLLVTGSPCFSTVLYNCGQIFCNCTNSCANSVVKIFY